MFREKQGLNLI